VKLVQEIVKQLRQKAFVVLLKAKAVLQKAKLMSLKMKPIQKNLELVVQKAILF
jgi:hypothetical protein